MCRCQPLRTAPCIVYTVSQFDCHVLALIHVLSRFFRRLLGSRGDAFSFEEVFGERYWYPHSAPAAALFAEQNNRTAMVKVS
jgi:hypothetical protein